MTASFGTEGGWLSTKELVQPEDGPSPHAWNGSLVCGGLSRGRRRWSLVESFILQDIQNGGETGSKELTVDDFCQLKKKIKPKVSFPSLCQWVLVGTS